MTFMLRTKNLKRELFLLYDRSVILKLFFRNYMYNSIITVRIYYETVINKNTIGYGTIVTVR